MKKNIFLLTLLLSILLCGSVVFSQLSTGKITGKVVDQEGNPLPGVSIEARSLNMVGSETAITDNTGTYRLHALPPGQYEITFSLQGFKTVKRTEIYLSIEQTLAVDLTMEMGIEEEITVLADTPLIDFKSTTQGMTMEKEVFDTLPKTRNFDSVVDFIAGTDRDEEYAGGTSFDGASGLENMFYVDGMDTTDTLLGQVEQNIAFEFIEEIQIKSSGYSAEFGGSLGGVVNVVTRSGGNEFHGEVLGYFSGSSLKGKERDSLRLDPFDPTKAEYVNYEDLYGKDRVQRYEIGFGLGGYIVRDRLWFFTSFLPVFRNTTRHVNWISPGYGEDDYTEKRRWYNMMGKISAQPMKGLRLSLSGVNNFSTYSGELPERIGGDDPEFPWSESGFDFPNYTISFTADATLGRNTLLGVRGGIFKTNMTNQKYVVDEPRYVFSSGTTNAAYPDLVAQYPEYIRPGSFENYSTNLGLQANKKLYVRSSGNIDFTHYFNLGGEHALKAGFQIVHLVDDLDRTYPFEYFQFWWDEDYFIFGQEDILYKGDYGYYRVSESGEYGEFGKISTNRLTFYIQDSWAVTDKLVLNFGVRAEKEEIPAFTDFWQDWEEARNFKFKWGFFDKFAPRIGAIYDVFGNGKFKVFGNFAIYYDVIKLLLSESAYGAMVRKYNYYTLDDPEWWNYGNGYIPGEFINSIFGYRPSFDATDPDMKAMAQREISLGFERQLKEDVSVSARVVWKSLLYGIEDLGISTPGGTFWWIGNPGYGISLNETNGGEFPAEYPDTPKAIREYYAVNIEFEKRLSHNWMGSVSYTWSRLTGNFSGLANTDSGQLYPNELSLFDRWYKSRDRNLDVIDGVLASDRSHALKVYGSYAFDFGLTVGVSTYARSGFPVSREVSVPSTYFPDGRLTDGRTSFLITTDLYATYDINLTSRYRFQLNLNVTNLFDAKTARKKWDNVNRIRIAASDADKLTGTWNYEDFITDENRDPRFLQEHYFLPPIEVRIGFKFFF